MLIENATQEQLLAALEALKNPQIFRKCKCTGAVIEFDGLTSGTIVNPGTSPRKIGEYQTTWVAHTDEEFYDVVIA